MDFLTKEERENLIIEYKHLHDENWQRGQGIWIVNSILITGSLIVAFQPTLTGFPTPVVSLMLVIIATVLHATGNQITSITYKRMEKIRKKLGIIEPTRMYKSKIRGTWWHIVRINAAYTLFIFLMGVYLFLLFNNPTLLLVIFSAGFIILLVKEVYAYFRRAIEREQEKN